MATNYALRVNATHGSAIQRTVGTAATTAGLVVALTAVRYWVIADVDTYIRFGPTTALTAPTTANAMWIPASIPHIFDKGVGSTAAGTTFAKVLRKGTSNGKIAFLPVA